MYQRIKHYSVHFLLVSFLFTLSTTSHATIISGDLRLNGAGNLRTASNGTTYIGKEEVDRITKVQTVKPTSAGGLYEDYHISSQPEVYEFFNYTNTVPDAVDISETPNLSVYPPVDTLLPRDPVIEKAQMLLLLLLISD